MAHGGYETEIKLAVPSAAEGLRLLASAGFRISKLRVLEKNTVFDTSAFDLRNTRQLLRIRSAGATGKLTYKGPPEKSKHKSREEIELDVGDAGALAAILIRLGYRSVFRYEKYRTEFEESDSSGVATLDETPIGVWLELEGSPSWIDTTAQKLGFGEQDYVTASYGRLYIDWCASHATEPSNMLFT